jgi:hypothetical protein
VDHALNLPGRHVDAAGLFQMSLGFQVGGLVGAFQAEEFGQCRRIAPFQSQRRVGRVMALLFAGVIIVLATEDEAPKHTVHPEGLPALAHLSWLGLVGRIDPVGRLLEQTFHQCVGRLEDGGAHQRFQLLDRHAVGLLRPEAGHQLLDFLLLGQEELGRRVFFLAPAARSARVFSTMS